MNNIYIYICVYIYIYIYTHVYIYIYIYIYTHMTHNNKLLITNKPQAWITKTTHIKKVIGPAADARFSSNGYGRPPYEHYWFQRVWLKCNLKFKGWNSQAHREFPGKFDSSNVSRDNVSREIVRKWDVALSRTPALQRRRRRLKPGGVRSQPRVDKSLHHTVWKDDARIYIYIYTYTYNTCIYICMCVYIYIYIYIYT